jgi:site-specific DNA-methyltransferase (adenine-specific)
MSWKDMFPKENRYFETENGILYNAEAIETMSKFPQQIFDAIITDLPYGTTVCKWDSVIPFEDMWRELKRIRKDRTPIVLFGSEPFSSALRMSNIKEFKYDWIWKKTKAGNFQLCRKQPMKYHEIISVFYKKFPTFNLFNLRKLDRPIKSSRKNKGSNLGHCTDKGNYFQTETGFHFSILEFSNKSGKGYSYHPTQKPLALLEYLIKTYTNEGDLVLDFTCGSGTTLVVCEKLNRKWIGIEINEEYCEIAKQRIKNTIKQLKETK